MKPRDDLHLQSRYPSFDEALAAAERLAAEHSASVLFAATASLDPGLCVWTAQRGPEPLVITRSCDIGRPLGFELAAGSIVGNGAAAEAERVVAAIHRFRERGRAPDHAAGHPRGGLAVLLSAFALLAGVLYESFGSRNAPKW